ncbi:unnamed protein product [Orchesella dallaii]|uniref:Uncharacterized protein n=1 Tax=Orchesella dallaii TaxID=48710 RepID=A0ABP1R711_9HEXA
MSEHDTVEMNIPSEDEDSWLAEEEVSPPPTKKPRYRVKLPQYVLDILQKTKTTTIPQSPPAPSFHFALIYSRRKSFLLGWMTMENAKLFASTVRLWGIFIVFVL